MNIAQTIHLADTWGMHGSGGWWILGAVVMVVFMGGMMWMMMRGMRGGSSQRSSAPSETPGTTKSAVEILERRFADGEISVEDYRERLDVLTRGTGAPNGRHKDKALTASGQGEGRQS